MGIMHSQIYTNQFTCRHESKRESDVVQKFLTDEMVEQVKHLVCSPNLHPFHCSLPQVENDPS